MNTALNLSVLGLLFILSGFFSSTETALFSLSKLDRRKLKERFPRASAWVLELLEKPRRTLGTILIGNLIVNTSAAAMATLLAVEYLGEEKLGLAMVFFTVLFIVVCEAIPKIIAVRNKIRISLITAIPLRFFAYVFTPLRLLMRFITEKIVSMLVREKVEQPDLISENELKVLVKIGEEEGVFRRQERFMIQKLLDLGERPVKDIMTPRTDVIGLDIESSEETHAMTIKNNHYRHMPVFQESLDNILGVVTGLEYLLAEPRPQVKDILKKALFVPESKRIDDLLETFRTHDERFAVCVDEYGGTAGIVTQEDVLEEIFGEFYDEYASIENPVRQLGAGTHVVEGKISLQDFNAYFLSNLESEESTTLGGYLLEKMGEVPVRSAKYETEDFEFTVQSMIRQRIQHVLVRKRL